MSAPLRQRPATIALIDGFFRAGPAVWYKESLWALATGAPVFGAASIGTLRAVKLEPFGMVGVGWVFRAFRNSVLTADDEMAVAHSLAERTNPVPFTDELFLTQTFARFQGPLLRLQLSAEAWAQLAQAFDPTSEAYLFRRNDARFAFAITLYYLGSA
ncbi:MAG: hypothetical protein KatS3mg061_1584 [Dehalococcoidia bacterium]|nr:MAG: hypothetical protein KatS3mg061_1584 [Dehalococcoidia bacterium]